MTNQAEPERNPDGTLKPGHANIGGGRPKGSTSKVIKLMREHKDLDKVVNELFKLALQQPTNNDKPNEHYDATLKMSALKTIADKTVPSLKAQEIEFSGGDGGEVAGIILMPMKVPEGHIESG